MADTTRSNTTAGTETPPPDVTPWLPLDRSRTVALVITLCVSAALLLPQVVWAPQFGDPGEVQVTAAVGGVGHPPGQAGIINIMRLLCVALPLPPYFIVCLANALFALAAVGVLTLILLRTSVHPVIAILCSLLFLTDDQFWHAGILPETYATCYLLLFTAIYSFLSWLNHRRTLNLWLAIGLYAYLIVNRAPTALIAVAFITVMAADAASRDYWKQHFARKVSSVLGIVACLVLFVLASLWVRDVPGPIYNYLDQSYPSLPEFPPTNDDPGDRFQRIKWLVSATQYDYMFQPTWRTIRGQTRWLLSELGGRRLFSFIPAAALVVVGWFFLKRRDRRLALFVLIMIPATILPILLIRVISHTAMLPNLLFPLTILMSQGLSALYICHRGPWHKMLIVSVIGSWVWWTADASFLHTRPELDARPHIARYDLESLPKDAMLMDFDVLPLTYIQQVHGIRPDVSIVIPLGRLNCEYLNSVHRPVFVTDAVTVPPHSGIKAIGQAPLRELNWSAD